MNSKEEEKKMLEYTLQSMIRMGVSREEALYNVMIALRNFKDGNHAAIEGNLEVSIVGKFEAQTIGDKTTIKGDNIKVVVSRVKT